MIVRRKSTGSYFSFVFTLALVCLMTAVIIPGVSAAPGFTSITPDHGPTTGTAVTIAGSGFNSLINNVTFGGAAATSVHWVDANTLTAVTPPDTTGLVNIVITNPDLTFIEVPAGYYYIDPPTFTSITPNHGATLGGTDVVIIGTNFVDAGKNVINVTIGGVNAEITSLSDTEIDATTRAHAAGAVYVNITALGGVVNQSGAYTYAFPTVTGITPSTGVNTSTVTITNLSGTNFATGAAVRLNRTGFADINAGSVVVVSPENITCTFPLTGKVAGVYNVVVTNTDGTTGMLTNGFTVTRPPTVNAITPSTGGNTSTISITNLSGTYFATGATVKLNRTGFADITATGVTVNSARNITCTFDLTGKVAGVYNVVVTNATDGLSGMLTNGFTVTAPPMVNAITPSTGGNTSTISITNLSGKNFATGATVNLTRTGYPNITATGVTVRSATNITCTFDLTGKVAGVYNIVVTNTTDGLYGMLTNGFTVTNSPTVNAITPSTGVNTSTISITNLSGTNFATGAAVNLTRTGYPNITATGVTVQSATNITCTFDLTGKVAGVYNVVVTNTTDGLSGMLTDGFTVTNLTSPTVNAITPSTGVNTSTISITNLSGTNFATGATVKLNQTGFADIPGTSVTIVSATNITCTFDLTGKAAGVYNVVVTNTTDGLSGMLTNGFTVTNVTRTTKIGIFRNGLWVADYNGNYTWDGTTVDRAAYLGQADDNATIGDWNANGKDKIGIFRNGVWVIDYNGNYTWDGTITDRVAYLGQAGDIPVVGNWSGNANGKIGVFRNGVWVIDYNGNYQWDGTTTDRVAYLGQAGDTPVVGNWNGDGTGDKIGVFRNGLWVVDYNGNYIWDGTTTDRVAYLGQTGDIPVVGDWNGDGKKEIGVFRNGLWVVDYNGNYIWDGTTTDRVAYLGQAGDIPVVGDWNNDGKDEIGVFHDGLWVLDYNGNYQWDGTTTDRATYLGQAGDKPVVGKW